ncbi:hypothetical protein DFH09DRAFT_1130531 [Mycena vulgaris]|nr:hypothetical protein DFH09DRAFT_1130531 [Mycena vulgaris]
MAPLARLANAVLTYKLSYQLQRPYPWRYTTPIVLFLFLIATILLVLVNIPLSAYDVVSESTYSPNDTTSPLPFKALIPGYFRPEAVSFTPQTLTSGETIRPNGSQFEYQISQVYDVQNTSQTAFSLSYSNNPMSDCDVSALKFRIYTMPPASPTLTAWALISCWSPVPYTLTWTFDLSDPTSTQAYNPSWYHVMQVLSAAWPGILSSNTTTFGKTDLSIMVRPCCDCTIAAGKPNDTWITPSAHTNLTFPNVASVNDNIGLENTQFLMTDHPPCDSSSQPAEFLQLWPVTNTALSAPSPLASMYPAPAAALANAFTATYHILRLDLGVIRPNQIYTSVAKLNASLDDPARYPNQLWHSDCSGTTCYQPLPAVPTSFRTVVMSYVKPVFKRKPLASAVVSVFVSTFAMVSALWAIFNLVARVFVRDSQDNLPSDEREQSSYLMTDYDNEIPPRVMARIRAAVLAEWKMHSNTEDDRKDFALSEA